MSLPVILDKTTKCPCHTSSLSQENKWTLESRYTSISISTLNKTVCRGFRKRSFSCQYLTLPEHLSSPPFFSGVRVTRSLVLCVYFVDPCLFFCTFSFGQCIVCCLFFFDIQILITPLIYSNSSYIKTNFNF